MVEIIQIANPNELEGIIEFFLIKEFGVSNSWRKRQTFLKTVLKLLKCEQPPVNLLYWVFPCIEKLANDPVPNVRLLVAKCINQLLNVDERIYQLKQSQYYPGRIVSMVCDLQFDNDRDVRDIINGIDRETFKEYEKIVKERSSAFFIKDSTIMNKTSYEQQQQQINVEEQEEQEKQEKQQEEDEEKKMECERKIVMSTLAESIEIFLQEIQKQEKELGQEQEQEHEQAQRMVSPSSSSSSSSTSTTLTTTTTTLMMPTATTSSSSPSLSPLPSSSSSSKKNDIEMRDAVVTESQT